MIATPIYTPRGRAKEYGDLACKVKAEAYLNALKKWLCCGACVHEEKDEDEYPCSDCFSHNPLFEFDEKFLEVKDAD